MKKISLFFFLFFLFTFSSLTVFSQSTTTVSFRVNSPRILYDYNNTYRGNCENLEFDIEVKADALTRYDALQVNMSNNNSALTDFDWVRGYLQFGSTWAGYYSATPNMVGGTINVSVGSTEGPTSGSTGRFAQLTTSWQVLGTVVLRITDISAVENASFLTGGLYMDGQQYEKYFGGSPGIQTYLGYTLTNNISNLYLGRIYSSTWAWSQVGGATPGTQYTDWSTARNTSIWDTTGGAAAQITTTNCQANNLRIHAGARLDIDYAANLTTSGSIEINEPKGIIIKSHTSTPYERGQLKDNGSITYNNGGSFQVMASFPQDQWHYYCIPFTQASMNSVLPYQGIYMKYYEENLDHWKFIMAIDTNLNTMQMRGYSIWPSSTPPVHPGTVYPTGPINTGSISLTCTRSSWSGGGNNGYNLIGNPYTSSIDLENAGWSCAANVDATAYYWDGTTYQTYGWVSHAGSGPRYPAPQQAFMVHLNSGTNATVSVNHDARVVTNGGTPTKDLPAIPDYIILKATANGISDDAHIIFNSNSTIGFDPEVDAYKLFGVETAPNFYSRMDTIMAVNELPWTGLNQVVPMGFKMGIPGPVTITASNIESFKPGTRIYLEDKKVANTQELTSNPIYTFTASPNDDPNRFVLHFYNPSYGIEDKNLASMQIYSFEDYVYVRNLVKGTTKGTIQIYDMLGRKVFQENLKDMELNKYLPGINEGYYMIRVVTSDNFYTQKIYLK